MTTEISVMYGSEKVKMTNGFLVMVVGGEGGGAAVW